MKKNILKILILTCIMSFNIDANAFGFFYNKTPDIEQVKSAIVDCKTAIEDNEHMIEIQKIQITLNYDLLNNGLLGLKKNASSKNDSISTQEAKGFGLYYGIYKQLIAEDIINTKIDMEVIEDMEVIDTKAISDIKKKFLVLNNSYEIRDIMRDYSIVDNEFNIFDNVNKKFNSFIDTVKNILSFVEYEQKSTNFYTFDEINRELIQHELSNIITDKDFIKNIISQYTLVDDSIIQ